MRPRGHFIQRCSRFAGFVPIPVLYDPWVRGNSSSFSGTSRSRKSAHSEMVMRYCCSFPWQNDRSRFVPSLAGTNRERTLRQQRAASLAVRRLPLARARLVGGTGASRVDCNHIIRVRRESGLPPPTSTSDSAAAALASAEPRRRTSPTKTPTR